LLKILVTGGSGFIGRNVAEYFGERYSVSAPSSADLNLLDTCAVRRYLADHRFDVVVHAATTRSNRRNPAAPDLLDRNCRMFFNLVRNAGLFGKMIHFGSGAEYDRTGLPSRVREDYFDTRVPADPYSFSKYICAKYIECTDRLVNLRLFGVFGKYESWDVRFISNACCRVIKGLPIVIRQNVVFDYLYVEDLAKITAWFIENDTSHKAYNVCTGRGIALTELAELVANVSGRAPRIAIRNSGLGPEYTGDNSRLLQEIGPYEWCDVQDSIRRLYVWYEHHAGMLDVESLRLDD
jgi:UDP-glucose 4-epimerase